jgi:hypothetical protein
MPRLVVLPVTISHAQVMRLAMKQNLLLSAPIAHVLNTIFLRSDAGATPLMSRMCILPLGKAMESRTARLH